MLHLISFAVSSFPVMLRQIFWTPDLVIIVAPALVCAPAALLVARLSGATAWLHMQDFEVDIAFRMNLLRGSFLKRLVLRMERSLLRRFDMVSSISNRMVETLLIKGVPSERVCYFPNWVDIEHVNPAINSSAMRSRLKILREAVVVLFSGTLGGKQGLMIIPDAARLLSATRSDIVFVICGDGMMKFKLEAATADLSNVRMIPLQPFEQLGELLCMADIHLLPQSKDAADLVLPSKLSAMLASGRPVIATCLPDSELYSVVNLCGLVVHPQDANALAQAVISLADDPQTRYELGRRARVHAEINFEREAILGRVFAEFEDGAARLPDDAVA